MMTRASRNLPAQSVTSPDGLSEIPAEGAIFRLEASLVAPRKIASLINPIVAGDAACEIAELGVDRGDVGVSPGRNLLEAGNAEAVEQRHEFGADAFEQLEIVRLARRRGGSRGDRFRDRLRRCGRCWRRTWGWRGGRGLLERGLGGNDLGFPRFERLGGPGGLGRRGSDIMRF